MWSERRGEHLPFCLAQDLDSLLGLVNETNLEFHPMLARALGLESFAKRIAQLLAERLPVLVTAHVSRRERPGRVLVDWGKNDRHKSIVAPWSLRGGLEPTVSVPLTWAEVEAGDELVFAPEQALRCEDDPWAPLLSLRQRLPRL